MQLVYITCKNNEEARDIASFVIEDRLAACANIFPAHQSLYFWEGKIQSDAEVAMILKTTKENFPELKAAIVEKHSYETPCIIALDITDGHAPFLNWIKGSTK